MTTGVNVKTPLARTSPNMKVTYQSRESSATSPGVWFGWSAVSIQEANQAYKSESTRTWQGGDQEVRDPIIPRMKRKYTIPVRVSVPNKRGIVIDYVNMVTKSFWTKPVKGKLLRMDPHQYTMSGYLSTDCPYDYDERLQGPGVKQYENRIRNESIQRSSGWPLFKTNLSFDDNDHIKLVNKLKGKIRGSDFNLAVFLGEGHEALTMIADTTTRIAHAYTSLRRGNFVEATRTLVDGGARVREHKWTREASRDTSSKWLELQYGWKPLLSDMHGAAEMLAAYVEPEKAKRYSATIRKVEKHTDKTRKGSLLRWERCSQTIVRRIIAVISKPESNLTMSGLLDPELVAWELLPFSFVADWVIPIGDYMEARAFASRLEGTFITTDYYEVKGDRVSGFYPSPGRTILTFNGGGAAKYRSGQLNRYVGNSLSVPMPQVKTLSQIATWSHAANGLALLAQVFSKPSKIDYEVTGRARDAFLRDVPRERVRSEFDASSQLMRRSKSKPR